MRISGRFAKINGRLQRTLNGYCFDILTIRSQHCALLYASPLAMFYV